MKKRLMLALAAIVTASALLVSSPRGRAWASVQGDYIFHLLVLRGPQYVFKSTVGGAQGIKISTNPYAGASQTGQPNAPAGDLPLWLTGGQATSGRSACAAGTEGQLSYDPTVHSLAFCNGTSWYKSVDSGSAVTWTIY